MRGEKPSGHFFIQYTRQVKEQSVCKMLGTNKHSMKYRRLYIIVVEDLGENHSRRQFAAGLLLQCLITPNPIF